MRDFRRYEVWRRSIQFCKQAYQLTSQLPDIEKYGIKSQQQRATVSIPSNIAEGCSRKSERDFARFIEIAQGSAFETESLLLLCLELEYIDSSRFKALLLDLQVIQKQLNSLYS